MRAGDSTEPTIMLPGLWIARTLPAFLLLLLLVAKIILSDQVAVKSVLP